MARVTVGVLAALLLGGCGASARTASERAPATRPSTSAAIPIPAIPTTTAPTATVTPRPRRRHPAPNPGSLPQTGALPSASTPAFRSEMRGLWRAIVADSPQRAQAAFFPSGAYEQLKAIAYSLADYRDRLLGELGLDVHAAHLLLGSLQEARLVRVLVPGAYAHWVPPGVCYNRVGYYEVPNSRIVYADGSQIRSFGIASLISWRGVWYVIHLGAVVRASEAGVVDDPSSGTGVSVPSTTC